MSSGIERDIKTTYADILIDGKAINYYIVT